MSVTVFLFGSTQAGRVDGPERADGTCRSSRMPDAETTSSGVA